MEWVIVNPDDSIEIVKEKDYIETLEMILDQSNIIVRPNDSVAKKQLNTIKRFETKINQDKKFFENIRLRNLYILNCSVNKKHEMTGEKIVITGTGIIMTATLKYDNIFKVAFLFCSPEDEFDMNYGKNRLFGRLRKQYKNVGKTHWAVKQFDVNYLPSNMTIFDKIKSLAIEVAFDKSIKWMKDVKVQDMLTYTEFTS